MTAENICVIGRNAVTFRKYLRIPRPCRFTRVLCPLLLWHARSVFAKLEIWVTDVCENDTGIFVFPLPRDDSIPARRRGESRETEHLNYLCSIWGYKEMFRVGCRWLRNTNVVNVSWWSTGFWGIETIEVINILFLVEHLWSDTFMTLNLGIFWVSSTAECRLDHFRLNLVWLLNLWKSLIAYKSVVKRIKGKGVIL